MPVEDVFKMLGIQETAQLVDEPAKVQLTSQPRVELDPEIMARRAAEDARKAVNQRRYREAANRRRKGWGY